MIELETRKLSVYTEMQQDERNARLEALKNEKKEREAEREKRKYMEYNRRRAQEEQEASRDESCSKGLLSKMRQENASEPLLEVLSNQQSNIITVKKNMKALHESVRELMEEVKMMREDIRATQQDVPTLIEKVSLLILRKIHFIN